MKVIITGSLGNISKPLTQQLTAKGHNVTVISSKPDKTEAIEALGATAAIGSLEDVRFLTETFKGADVAYCMTSPNYYYDQSLEPVSYTRNLGRCYAQAILASGIKRVVHLSSFGAELTEGTGFILGAHEVEKIFTGLPQEVLVTTMRPTSFYYNLLGFIPQIKSSGAIAANYGADDLLSLVSPLDIADAVAEEIERPTTSGKVRYVASEELTGNEMARILGRAIGKPNLKWNLISDQEMLQQAQLAGLSPHNASLLTEMYSSLHSGKLAEDYNKHKPKMGRVKLRDFAKEFAAVYHQN